ncbi:cell surface protein [Listeria monocytogenes]|nr:cell surface protein [Listeria monocytogenes]
MGCLLSLSEEAASSFLGISCMFSSLTSKSSSEMNTSTTV